MSLPVSFQMRFTIAAAKAHHYSVSHQYKREPPSPRFIQQFSVCSTTVMWAGTCAVHTSYHSIR